MISSIYANVHWLRMSSNTIIVGEHYVVVIVSRVIDIEFQYRYSSQKPLFVDLQLIESRIVRILHCSADLFWFLHLVFVIMWYNWFHNCYLICYTYQYFTLHLSWSVNTRGISNTEYIILSNHANRCSYLGLHPVFPIQCLQN